MPPGQPILECEKCGRLMPCKKQDGVWICAECNPNVEPIGA